MSTEPETSAPTFYIPALGAGVERSRILKHGDTFALFDLLGDLPGESRGVEGIYHRDTRHLHFLRLRLDGRTPLLLSSHVQRNNARLNVDLTNPDYWRDGVLELPRDSVHVGRMKFLWESGVYEILTLRNFSDRPLRVTLEFHFGADFRDIFEVRGLRRERRGTMEQTVEGSSRVWLRYTGLDEVTRFTRLDFSPDPDELHTEYARFAFELERGQRVRLALTIHCSSDRGERPPVGSLAAGVRRAHRARVRASQQFPTVITGDELFNEWLCRATADLVMLATDTPYGPYPYAGIPWFSTVFGRDGLITALEVLWANPDYARGVLGFLAAHQADCTDPARAAEPGKILHEMRQGEMAHTGEIPFGAYYGSVDATPLFVWLAAEYFFRTADWATIRRLYPHIQRALQWFDSATDAHGFLRYAGETARGLRNQGWKDSEDAVFHADGELARGPIALCEIQGYLYAARLGAAALARALGDHELARVQEAKAAALQQQFETHFWLPAKQFYALALDGRDQPCAVATSNAGHLLLTGICQPQRGDAVRDALFSPRFFSGWGIRTVAAGEARYNPMSYHNGSVWPHDNALIALGLARRGDTAEFVEIFHALFEAAIHMELRRLPELYCGFSRRRDAGPTLYPVACSPQAWAAAVPWALLGATLGIHVDAERSTVVLRRPVLPRFLDWVRIRDLRVLGGQLSLHFRRADRTVAVEVEEASPGLRVEVQPR
ncbi:MAG: amylo-alpha-1,6-glucosidase [Fimbriimonadales bacterium]|nr:MAG: amylo-alpha-1,6-glucosidase [Fimbriimonadales bacterium]